MDTLKNKLDIADSVQKNLNSDSKSNVLTLGHSGHSTFIEKAMLNNNVNIGKIEKKNIYIYKRFSENIVSTVSNPKTPAFSDPRFNSPEFRKVVRFVLNFLGEPQTFGSFKKWEAWGMDWQRQYQQLTNPVKLAQVYILDSNGQRIYLPEEQRYATTLITDKELQENKNYELKKWW